MRRRESKVINCQWLVISGQLPVASDQWLVISGQWADRKLRMMLFLQSEFMRRVPDKDHRKINL